MSKLRLVKPPGQEPPRPPGRRSPALMLSTDEVRRVRASIRNTAHAYGGLDVLASILGLPAKSLYNVAGSRAHMPSGTFAIRLAKAAGVSVESILTGAITEAGKCKACGRRLASGGAS
jgi:hypothetical protein